MHIACWSRVVLLVTMVSVSACSGTSQSPVPAPSPAASPGPAATFSLSGKIVSFGATPIAGATVSIGDGPNAGQVATTDSAGQYQFTALQQSGFTVTVSATDYMPQSMGVTLTSNRTLNFSLRPLPAAITLTGRVTDATTGAAIAGAIVSINGRYRGPTDGSGQFSVPGLLDLGTGDYTYVSADNYFADYHLIHGTTQNVRLRRVERIMAGESRSVTVAPDDSFCVNNMQDSPGIGTAYVCRSLLVTVPQGGNVTIEAVSTSDGTHPQLEVETRNAPLCCDERFGNPTTISVAAGVEIVVNVEMVSTSPQSFLVVTSPPH